MRTATAVLHASLLATGIGLLTIPATVITSPVAAAPAPAGTEDVLYLNDGRVFHGKVVSEGRREIVFEFVDRVSNIRTKLKFAPDQIMKIDRDVPLEDAPEAAPTRKSAAPARTGTAGSTSRPGGDRFIDKYKEQSRSATDDPNVPSVYLIPMAGQMGTDIRLEVYEGILDDIRDHEPDLVVWVLDCTDITGGIFQSMDKDKAGAVDLGQYRDLVNVLHDGLADIPQVMWVKDSVGVSSVMALAWNEMYMHPDARLAGLGQIYARAANWDDADVKAKMVAAWVSIGKSFLASGGRQLALGEAMMDPNMLLSASWKGREVEWRLDKTGEYLVDGTDKGTAAFRAKNAVDLCIAAGRAEEIDDLMLLKGYREYRLIDGAAPDAIGKYIEDWRRALERAVAAWKDFQQHMSWATGQDAIKYLGQAKKDLVQVAALMDRFEAVELRFSGEVGQRVNKAAVEQQIQVITEQLRELRASERGGAAGGRGGRGGGRGGPGGPEGR